jgi:hypothetical protein
LGVHFVKKSPHFVVVSTHGFHKISKHTFYPCPSFLFCMRQALCLVEILTLSPGCVQIITETSPWGVSFAACYLIIHWSAQHGLFFQ